MIAELAAALGVPLAAIGAQRVWSAVAEARTRRAVRAYEAATDYEPDLGFVRGAGEPVFLVRPGNTTTLFFWVGFRMIGPRAMYGALLDRLHRDGGVNVIAPVVGPQSAPFSLRNAAWDYRTDIRHQLQIYDAYAATLPPGHRVVVGSECFGVLPSLVIAAKRAPDAMVMIAPSTSAFSPGGRGGVVARSSLAPLVVPYHRRPTPYPRWDVRDPACLARARRIPYPPEFSVAQYYQLRGALRWLEDRIVPQVRGRDIAMVWGELDQFLPQGSLHALAGRLRAGGNRVQEHVFPDTGHYPLLDAVAPDAERAIAAFITGGSSCQAARC